MSDVPKCSSWLGHKFEGRFTEHRACIWEVEEISSDLIEAMRSRSIYERDICVRCGWTVEKQTTKTAETQG